MHKVVTLTLCIFDAESESDAISKFEEQAKNGEYGHDSLDVEDCDCD